MKLQLDIPIILAAILFKSQWLSGRASDFKSGVLGSNPGGAETKFEIEKKIKNWCIDFSKNSSKFVSGFCVGLKCTYYIVLTSMF